MELGEASHNVVTITGSTLVRLAEHRFGILLLGHYSSNQPFSETLEVTHEALSLLRTEVSKAEKCLSMPTGTV